MSNIRYSLRTLIVAFAMIMTCASLASATTVQRPFPNGIDKHNPNKAWVQVQQRAAIDVSYAQTIAVAAGMNSFDASAFVVVGYGRVTKGDNTGTDTATGDTIGVPDTEACKKKAKALIIRSSSTGEEVEICTECGNTRKHRGRIQPVRWQTGTSLRVREPVQVPIKGRCPSGVTVTGTVPVRINGIIRGRAWGRVLGRVTARIRVGYRLAIKAGKARLKCKGVSTPTRPAPPAAPPIIQQIVCGTGTLNFGDGNTTVNNGIYCPVQITPPVEERREESRTPALVAQTPGLAHVYLGGNDAGRATLFLKVKPSFSYSIITVLPRVTSGGGNVSDIQDSLTYAREQCPADWKCFRASFWASNSTGPGRSTVTWYVSQDDGQRLEAPIDISIEADDFPV